MARTTAGPEIMVGVDGSEESKAALTWAVGLAGAMGGRVCAVTVWEVPPTIFLNPHKEEHYAEAAETMLEEIVDEVAPPDSGVEVETGLIRGASPARRLVEESRGADLLVVGRRGRGALAGMHLGSVASYCVDHATCPCVVVRASTVASVTEVEGVPA